MRASRSDRAAGAAETARSCWATAIPAGYRVNHMRVISRVATLTCMSDAWRTAVAPDWADALEPVAPVLASIGVFLREELAAGRPYLPASGDILNAFRRPLADVRVLLVGQDPCPTPGDRMGLSCSVPPGRPMPRSLANIAQELAADTGERLFTGDLTHWADQGVMLLNRCLTV